MINLLLGQPGGGKSYEAVAFHILPALAKGRKVITNLALVLDSFPPEQRDLIEIRTKTRAERPEETEQAKRFSFIAQPQFRMQPFTHIEDYNDPWRHPVEGFGPLYVIDECHLSLPRKGTPIEVEEWYSLHRHEFADVLLLTQGYGKVNAAIIDLVQVLYRCKKATAFGFDSRYIRKVYDGLKGDCVNTSERKYDKRYFKFYTSHTKSGAGKELTANDIVPIWKRWPFVLFPIFLVAFIILAFKVGINPMTAATAKNSELQAQKTADMKQQPEQQGVVTHSQKTAVAPEKPTTKAEPSRSHPFEGYGLHLGGYLSSASKGGYFLFIVSQNGQPMFTMNQDEFVAAGYKVHAISECAARVEYPGSKPVFAICDSPRIGMNPAANFITPKLADSTPPEKSTPVLEKDGWGVLGKAGPGVRMPGGDS